MSLIDRTTDAATWPIKAIVVHFENRLSELSMAMVMLAIAGWISVFPSVIADGAFRYLNNFMGRESLMLFFFMFGIARLAALVANGHWQYWGPIIRSACALAAAVLFGQMTLALINLSAEGIDPPISTGVYGVLALFELISMYRALARGYGGRGIRTY